MNKSNKDTISILWSTDDVLGRAKDLEIKLNSNEARKVLANIDHHHDANIGVNWENIDFHIGEFDQDRTKKENLPKQNVLIVWNSEGKADDGFLLTDDGGLVWFHYNSFHIVSTYHTKKVNIDIENPFMPTEEGEQNIQDWSNKFYITEEIEEDGIDWLISKKLSEVKLTRFLFLDENWEKHAIKWLKDNYKKPS